MSTAFAARSSIAARDERRVRHEEVVADELDPIAEPRGELAPAGPVVLAEAVLERDDRVAVDPVGPEVDQLAASRASGPRVSRRYRPATPSAPVPSTRIELVAGSSAIATSSPGR